MRFCEAWNARSAPVHVLINNAGIFSIGGWDSYIFHFIQNLHLFLLICSMNNMNSFFPSDQTCFKLHFFFSSYLEPQKFSKDGYEEHLQVNHLAPALLSILLLPSLIRGSPSRIVNVNSIVSSVTILYENTYESKCVSQSFASNWSYNCITYWRISLIPLEFTKMCHLLSC